MKVAIITAITSLIVAALGVGFTWVSTKRLHERDQQLAEKQGVQQKNLALLNASLDQDARQEERAHAARTALDQYREPLLRAALDLAARLNNIRNEGFLDAYLASGDTHREQIARSSTLYRFARYWCVVETLYDQVALAQFQKDEATRPVAGTLGEVGKTFASDDYGTTFMVWREEQRAIAELMRANDAPSGCIGYASFVERYEKVFAPWFASFTQSLDPATARSNERFQVLQGRLAMLAEQLDGSKTYRGQWRALRTDDPRA